MNTCSRKARSRGSCADRKLEFDYNLTMCHSEVPVKRARALKRGVPNTRGFCFARDGVLISARVPGPPTRAILFSARGGVGVGPRNLLRPKFLRPQAEPKCSRLHYQSCSSVFA